MWKKTTSLFTKKKGSSSSKPSSTTSSRRHEGNKEIIHEVYRTSRAYGGAARPTSSIDLIIRSTSVHSAVLHIWLHHHVGGRGEETLSP
jgi:hypothetical protein